MEKTTPLVKSIFIAILAVLGVIAIVVSLYIFASIFLSPRSFWRTEVVHYQSSPSGTHSAEVISNRRWIFTGPTSIYITRTSRLPRIFRSNSTRVYRGRVSGELTLYWESDTVLRVYRRNDVMVFTRTGNRWVQR